MFNKCANFAPGSQLCRHGADSSVHTEGKSATWTQTCLCDDQSGSFSRGWKSLLLLWTLECILFKGGKIEH